MTRRPPSTRSAVLLLALSLSAVAGCSDGADPSPVATGASTPASPTATTASASPVPSAAASPSASEPSAAASFPGDTRADTEEPTGGPLTVTAVRVARQDGFDRVVFELSGKVAGAPGWRVEYDDSPSADGSGEAVEVGGATSLAVVITGTGYPLDTGVAEPAGDPALPGDLESVEDVVLGSVFEGQYQAWIGVDAKRPFTVKRLSDPARVVVDVAHR